MIAEARDVLDERVDDGVPSWCERRGWTEALLAIEEGEVRACEAEGLVGRARRIADLPASLADLAAAIEEITRLPAIEATPIDAGGERSIRARKVPQLEALLGAVDAMAVSARRILDVGSGSGHFTYLAAEAFDREALGIERDPARVEAARARVIDREADARFTVVDAGREGLAFERDDLAVGLHACGALGDRIARAAAEAGCDVALVSCCLQKIDGPVREALSRAAGGLALRKETLGLSNLTSQARGVEATIEATMDARRARHALLRLLRERGIEVAPGEEMRGINRRRAHRGLGMIAEKALALRGLAPPTDAEIERHEREGARSFERVRRLSLPRNMLSRAVEIAVVLDRAAALEEGGLDTRVGTVFDRAVTPRNVGIFASRDGARLPRLGA